MNHARGGRAAGVASSLSAVRGGAVPPQVSRDAAFGATVVFPRRRLPMLFIILLVLLALSLGGGGWGYSRYGFVGFSPAGFVLAMLLIAWVIRG